MVRKLTLTIDQSVIEKAKIFARKRNKSVSRIVEEYSAMLEEALLEKHP